jgi:hypothetical protein
MIRYILCTRPVAVWTKVRVLHFTTYSKYQDQDQVVNSCSTLYLRLLLFNLPGLCRVSRVACWDKASRAKLRARFRFLRGKS